MQSEKTSRAPFDDRAALEELERLQQSIQEYRRRREMAEGEFEQFVSSFRKSRAGADEGVADDRAPQLPGFHTSVAVPPGVPAVLPPRVVPPPVVAAAPPAPVAAPIPATPPAPPPEIASIAIPDPGGPPPHVAPSVQDVPASAAMRAETTASAWSPADQADPESGPAPAVSLPDNFFSSATGGSPASGGSSAGVPATQAAGTRDFPGWIPWAFLGTAAALIAAVFLMRSGGAPAAPDETPAPAAVETPAAAPPALTPVTSPTPAPVAVPAPPAEIRTLRSVWVRVTVDGRREVERELEADAKIPLPAGRSFVIRAGDAGAVRFLLNGEDQGALGPDAQVVTRTFTALAR
ncbi:MAG: DUF4115 domain-containing protein [Acidobacteriota bacterium]|nr:DUF4115 domain-containing protein [Acidobacteriota bacterium]